ncbi:Aste57867_2326 [Aphanomyces stellatus]|uniref:Aste57867_2326 protein n=1 Tax=Aphanomyces stellatus TaxID=120398 RepID=A0A485KBL6_9STRA|nr:hypothetical protein As57867_002321 [Aphanomyces stellatus]VFT79528.1 Aste57867_2326 [Aphanomyces stellatus]
MTKKYVQVPTDDHQFVDASDDGPSIQHADDSFEPESARPPPTGDPSVKMEPPPAQHAIAYRPDIDGLRALAVVPVVIYHAYPQLLPGGYVGVDIFFVISGYLISSILFKEHAKGKFTYADFYSRRIRRIYPALILMLVVTLAVSFRWLLAKSLQKMAATLVAGGLFGANLQLLLVEEAYGDATLAADNPLLHLWSLGVEEQFYIFWPMFAALLVRLPTRVALQAQLVVLAASFTCNIVLLGYGGDNKYSFYFPLSRFWQMAIGGLIAYVNLATVHVPIKTATLKPTSAASLSMLGLGLILLSMILLDETSAFPGYWSLLPTLGAAAVIFAGPTTPFNHYVLGSSAMIFVGSISYPLYLWHWPMLVLAKLRYPVAALRAWYTEPYAVALLSIGCSLATLHLVENQLRRRKAPSLVLVLFLLMAGLTSLGVYVYRQPEAFSPMSQAIAAAKHRLPDLDVSDKKDVVLNWSKPPREAEITPAKILAADDYFDFSGFEQLETGQTDLMPKALNLDSASGRTVVVLGDSHANMLAPRFKRLFEVAKANGAPFPIVYFRARSNTPSLSCTGQDHASDIAFVEKIKPDVVFINSNWIQFLRGDGDGLVAKADPPCCRSGYADPCLFQSMADVRELVRRLQGNMAAFAAVGTKVFCATVNPEGDAFNFRNMLNGGQVAAIEPVRRSTFRNKHDRIISLVEQAIASANATLIDLSDNQCHDDLCQVVSMREGEPVMWDANHFRPYYARNYLTSLDSIVQAALAN